MKLFTQKEGIQLQQPLIVPIYEHAPIPSIIKELLAYDPDAQINRKGGALTIVYTLGKMAAPALYFVGMGKVKEITYAKAKRYLGAAFYQMENDCGCWLDTLCCEGLNSAQAAKACGYAFTYSTYRFQKVHARPQTPSKLTCISDHDIQEMLAQGELIAGCVNHARDLGNQPANLCTPKALVKEAQTLASACGLDIEILDKDALTQMGAGALLGVNQGSDKGAYLITLTYQNNGDAPFTALVGKGITFDSGGYTLKPRTSMSGMKFDMCGAANAMCALELAARSKAKVNLMAVLAITENKIGPNGYTVDDVLVSLSGKTIEITNTDAEGRLILCDALTYAIRKGAKRVIDIATLTGACITALGDRYTGAFTNSPAYLRSLLQTGEICGERIWQLPLDEEFHTQLHTSMSADLVNAVPNGKGGASLAAAFLEEFITPNVEWIHLDIAGPAETNGSAHAQKGASGVMVETLAALCSNTL